MEYQANNEPLKKHGTSMPKGKLEVVENMLQQGMTCDETAKLTKTRKSTIVSVRQQMETEGKLEMGSWKKEVANLLGEFVLKGAKRLNEEVDNMPIGQIPMSIAISIDKVRDLQDAPTVRVEARLRITQDELNNAFNIDSKKIIDITNTQSDKTPENTGENQQ